MVSGPYMVIERLVLPVGLGIGRRRQLLGHKSETVPASDLAALAIANMEIHTELNAASSPYLRAVFHG
jgi:hypothetical protein